MSPRPAFDALQISALDNTATLLKSVRISDEVVVGGQTDVLRIKALDDIPFGHKISIRDIRSRDSIVKYGEVIGTAPAIFLPAVTSMCKTWKAIAAAAIWQNQMRRPLSLRAVRKHSLRKYLIVPLLMHAASAIEGIPDLTAVWASVISSASFHA